MARSAKTGTDKPTSPEAVLDAVATQTPPDGAEVTAQAEPVSDPLPRSETETDAVAQTADAVLIVEDAAPLSASQPEPQQAAPWGQSPEPPVFAPSEAVLQDRPAPPPAPVIVRKTGFVPVLLGGVIAAGLGYVAAWQGYGLPAQTPAAQTDQLAADAARLAALEEQIAALPEPTPQDLGPLTDAIAAVQTQMTTALAPLTGDIAALTDSVAGLDDRLTALERAPAADGTLPDAAIAGWEAEIATLRDQIVDQQAQLQTIADAAASRLDAAQETVAQIEQNAAAQAAAALQRAAVTRMQAAIDAGTPFDTALADLVATGVTAPDALTAVATDGVPTIAALTDSFPDAARAALATARAEGLADDGEGRVASFFRRQLGVRSVAPREGSDPDAILSRAEGALREGRLSDTMAEVATLPEVVRAELAGWITMADARIAAIAALQTLSESLPAPDLPTSDLPASESLN